MHVCGRAEKKSKRRQKRLMGENKGIRSYLCFYFFISLSHRHSQTWTQIRSATACYEYSVNDCVCACVCRCVCVRGRERTKERNSYEGMVSASCNPTKRKQTLLGQDILSVVCVSLYTPSQ